MDNGNLFAVASSKIETVDPIPYNHNTLHHKSVVEARERRTAIIA